MSTQSDTFPKLLLDHARVRGERPAIREKRRGIWRTLTWRELADDVASLAAALSAQGVQRGAHVALIGDNRPRLYAAICATQWLGAVAVPLYQDATAAELVAPLRLAEATHVFAENQEQVDKLLEILPQCPSVHCIVYDDDRGMRHYKQAGLSAYDSLIQQGRALAATKREFLQGELELGRAGDAAFLFFTSGTAGTAKGVVFEHRALIDSARAAARAERLTEADVAMAYLPPGWIGQAIFSFVQPMVVGYCVCCPESSESMLADMREIGPTYFLAPPRVLETLLTQVTMRIGDASAFNQWLYRRFLAVGRRVGSRILAGEPIPFSERLDYALGDLLIFGPLRDVLGMRRIRVAYAGGDTVEPGLLMYFRALGVNLKQLYGTTETGFYIAVQPDAQVKADTVGPAAEGVELAFTPQGEILVRSPGLFREYHRDPQATAQARTAEGWFRTGDAGFLGEDGHLRVIDRVASVGALRDGSRHVPRPIENRLKVVPYVREAVAFGDGRDHVCMLVDIDTGTVGKWASLQGLSYTGHADLASLDEVYDLIAGCIAGINAELALDPTLASSQVRRFTILDKELDADDGLLTRTGKLRRDAIAERFRALIDALYDERDVHAREGGGAGPKVRDAKTFPPAETRRAA